MLHDVVDSPVARPVTVTVTGTGTGTFHDLMAGVGYLLFQWGLLDTSLDEEIGQLRRACGDPVGMPGRARTMNERLAEWRALLGRGRRRGADHHAAVERVATNVQAFQRCQALVAAGFVAVAAADKMAILSIQSAARQSGDGGMTLADIMATIEAMEQCRSEMALLRGLREH